jgi:hypothetical protein
MSEIRYRASEGLPEGIVPKLRSFMAALPQDLDLSYHAADEILADPLGMIPVPTAADLRDPENRLIEVYQDAAGSLTKLVIRRTHLRPGVSYTYVVGRDGTLVTAWANPREVLQ